MKFLLFFLVLVASSGFLSAKVYSKCELAKKLDGIFPREKLADWMCLVNYESGFNSTRKGARNRNGSYDYGIFQINDKYWCRVGSNGGDCNANCLNFLNDDITDDIKCAKKIYNRHKFEAWYGWKNNCKGKDLSRFSVASCF